jgi:polyribonucleotide nucleotidyltransferase
VEVAAGDDNAAIKDKLKKLIGKDITAAYKLTDKSARSNALNEARAKAKESLLPTACRRRKSWPASSSSRSWKPRSFAAPS